MQAQLFRVFTRDGEGGNPAAVVCGDEINPADASSVAREVDSYMTVFVYQPGGRLRFRFFTREGEIDFCGHGILAGAYAYASQTGELDFVAETNVRPVALSVAPDAFAQFEIRGQVSVSKAPADEREVLPILGIDPESINRRAPFCVASIGSPKLFVPVEDLQTLRSLSPNLTALKSWSLENRINGAYVYCLETVDPASLAHARAFNPLYNDEEDAATGAAAGALAGVITEERGLPASYVIEQGDALGKPCRIRADVGTNSIRVGGCVTPA